ncbi:LIM domain only protein 7-like isoform X2 [Melanotaenia boesemani]|uniref:LIM domain only protein 7-like isoform X2 n=1 Tax=Melanotaenia boesemani TaxID=1250792 RepID=UPI001C055615|nr:LIM domain only protein 7-like isoform X2 [Melanotaenia boesemani]
MEWRQQTTVSCAEAFKEAQRWIEEVTGKSFGSNDFRAALEDGVLLCDLINQLKPGIIKRVNRLSTPIAGLDNVSVFLKACGKMGLNDSQLFHPGDLQDLSTRVTVRHDESKRRLKNVLITVYWLGRKAQLDTFYSGPQLNFKAFEGLLGLALSKALEEGSNVFVKDGGYRECHYPEEEESQSTRPSFKRGNSVDCIEARAILQNDEGCGSDAEAEQVFRMEKVQPTAHQSKGYIPPPLRRKQRQEGHAVGYTSPLPRLHQIQVKPERPVQVNPGWIWSKSLSDIPMVYPVRKVSNGHHDKGETVGLAREGNQENKRKCSIAAKDSEAQWQDDLTKWKTRRWSTKSDVRRKSQEWEHVMNQMTNGAVMSNERYEEQEGPLKRDHSPWRYSPSPRPYSMCSPSKPPSSDLRPHTRVLLARSYATEAPVSPTAFSQESSHGAVPPSDGTALGKETYFVSLASDRVGVTTASLNRPFTSQTLGSQAPLNSTSEQAQPHNILTNQISSVVRSSRSQDPTSPMASHDMDPKGKTCPDVVNPAGVDGTEDLLHQNHKTQEESQKSQWDPAVDGRAQEETSLSKYPSRAGSWSSTASLPRGYRRSEGSSRLSSAITARPFGTKHSRMSSLPRLFNVDDGQGVLLNDEREDSLSTPTKPSLKRQTAAAHLRAQYQASVRQKKVNQAKQNGTEQREEGNKASFSNQNSLQDRSHPHQPSTQTEIQTQPYTNMQYSHNRSSSLPSNASTELLKVDHSDMRVSLTLKPNSLPDFGFHTHWDSTGARVKFVHPGSPAELCRLHVDDEIVAVDGVAVAHMTYNQWKDKMASSLQTGSLTMDIRRYGIKDWSSSDGSYANQPGQSRLTLNLTAAAPVLISCTNHQAKSAASTETDTQASEFNGQTEKVIQDKTTGGLSDNSNVARSKGGSESAISDLQVPSLSRSSSSWSWDHEEDRRRQEKWQEEQERLLQAQYQRDQERLEAEWQRAQQDAMEGRKSGDYTFEKTSGCESFASTQHFVNGLTTKTREKNSSPDKEMSEDRANLHSNAQRVHDDRIMEKDWAKSLSTPVLAGPHTQTGDWKKRKGQSVSKAEQERQQILEEMKKRTQLLTDNSWIRQRRSSCHKEPIYVGVSMKRYESLDNLDALRQPPDSAGTFTYPRSQSAAGGYCAPTRNASSRYSTGSVSSQMNAYPESFHHGGVQAAVDISEEPRLDSRFASETGNSTVSAAMSSSSPLLPSPCNQHDVLQIIE